MSRERSSAHPTSAQRTPSPPSPHSMAQQAEDGRGVRASASAPDGASSADDHQIMAILAHMSQQQSATKPKGPPSVTSDYGTRFSPQPGSPTHAPSHRYSKPPFSAGSPLRGTTPSTLPATRNSAPHPSTDPSLIRSPGPGQSGRGAKYPTPSTTLNIEVAPNGNGELSGRKSEDGDEDPVGDSDDLTRDELTEEIDADDSMVTASGPKRGRRGKSAEDRKDGKEEDWTRTRKDNHKEVERRRRETINEGINELKKIVPGCEKNKGSILQRAVQYIQQLKSAEASNIEKWTLEKLLTDQAMVEVKAELDGYKGHVDVIEVENGELREENERLREELAKLGVKIEHELSDDVSHAAKRGLDVDATTDVNKKRAKVGVSA